MAPSVAVVVFGEGPVRPVASISAGITSDCTRASCYGGSQVTFQHGDERKTRGDHGRDRRSGIPSRRLGRRSRLIELGTTDPASARTVELWPS